MKIASANREPASRLALTPMIDVVFLLLVFFVIGTRFRVPEGELAAHVPPNGGRGVRPPDLQVQVTLAVSQAGAADPDAPPALRLDGAPCASFDHLARALDSIARNEWTREQVPVVIKAEPGLAYQWVIRVLDLSRRAGFKQVRFAAQRSALHLAAQPPIQE